MKIIKNIIKCKKAQVGQYGWETIVRWAIALGLGILLLVILFKTTNFGNSVWEYTKNIFPFV